MELAEKLEEAVVAYLQSLTWPDSLKISDDEYAIFPGENDEDKTAQVLICRTDDSSSEEPPFSGNRMFTLHVELRTPVSLPSPLDTHKAAADALEKAIVVDGLADLVNAAAYAKAAAKPDDFSDLDNFCLYPVISRTPTRAQEEEYWASGFALSCYCMGIKG